MSTERLTSMDVYQATQYWETHQYGWVPQETLVWLSTEKLTSMNEYLETH